MLYINSVLTVPRERHKSCRLTITVAAVRLTAGGGSLRPHVFISVFLLADGFFFDKINLPTSTKTKAGRP